MPSFHWQVSQHSMLCVKGVPYSLKKCRCGAHLPSLAGCLWHMASVRPDLWLPSSSIESLLSEWYQIILLGIRGTRVQTTCPGLSAESVKVWTVTSNSQTHDLWVVSPAPNHEISRPHNVDESTIWSHMGKCRQLCKVNKSKTSDRMCQFKHHYHYYYH